MSAIYLGIGSRLGAEEGAAAWVMYSSVGMTGDTLVFLEPLQSF